MTLLFPILAVAALPGSPLGRIRLALVLLCLAVLLLTFESIRRTRLKERYALLWMLPCLLLLVLTAFPNILDWAQRTFGMTYASCMAAAVFLSLLVAAFVFSAAISANERNLARVAQRCAMLEARIRDLEGASPAAPEENHDGTDFPG